MCDKECVSLGLVVSLVSVPSYFSVGLGGGSMAKILANASVRISVQFPRTPINAGSYGG